MLNALLADGPVVMGVLNVTPDSFSDGGEHVVLADAVRQTEHMLAAGAGIIDVGGESTRPGAAAVPEADELARVLPVIDAVRSAAHAHGAIVSIDTRKAAVMHQAVEHGAGLINDVAALQEPGALEAAASCDVPICLMHMQGDPETMQRAPHYDDIVGDVRHFFELRLRACEQAGIDLSRIVLDPGFGFGKTLAHNIALFRGLDALAAMGFPLLVGLSRKSMLGSILDQPDPKRRVAGGLAAASLAVASGVAVIRTHDVADTYDAVRVAHALMRKSVDSHA